jgi:tripeptide aminopeptidase
MSRTTSSFNSPTSTGNATAHFTAAHQKSAIDLVMRLMAIPGPSGQEERVAQFVRDELRNVGVPAKSVLMDKANHRAPLPSKTGNLCLRLPGKRRGPRRLLMAHLDTVPICVGSRPRRHGRYVRSTDPATGLGADDRAGVAVTLFTALELMRRGTDHPPLTFLWTVQEEIGLHGARHLRLGMLGRPKLAFNWDGGAPFKMTVGATGGYRMQIDIHGLASHAGGAPQQGISAIAIAGLAIADLQNNGWHGLIMKGRKSGTCNIGVIEGGAATNVVTDHVTIKAEARSHDAAFRRRIVNQVERAFRSAVNEVRDVQGQKGRVTFKGQLDYDSFQLADGEPAVAVAAAAISAEGHRPLPAVTNGGLDANWMYAHGIPTVSLGCGQLNQHTVSEALDLNAYWDACRIAWRLATDS